MAGPWERYGGAPVSEPAVEAGPWEQYRPKPPEKPVGPQGFMENALDFAKSIPRGLVSGATSLPNPNMALSQDEMAQDMAMRQQGAAPIRDALPAPQGRAGRFGEAIGEGLGNPLAWAGPGGLALKAGGAALSSAAAEGAGQATEGSWYENPARLVAALSGGVAAGKALGPTAPKAAIPTSGELIGLGSGGYKAARNSGLELDPPAVSSWAAKVERELSGPDHGFTGGQYGTAAGTFDVLGKLQSPPAGAVAVGASNIDTLRAQLQHIASQTQPAQGGFAKPTPDAAAATIALKHLGDFTENIHNLPPGSVLAGSPQDYVRLLKEANANYGAGQRTRDFDARLTKAERAADRQIAGSIDAQIKGKAGQLIDNPLTQHRLSPDEMAKLLRIEGGDWKSNTLRQLGRGGAGVVPMMAQAAAAPGVFMAGGPGALALQASIAAGLYGARKGAEAMTKSRARELAEMLAKRSPEYERRVANLPPPDSTPQQAQMLRSLLFVNP